jgi:hypothetical protein
VNTLLAKIILPAKLLGLNGSLQIRALASTNNNANNKTLSATLGGFQLIAAIASGGTGVSLQAAIANRGKFHSQISFQPVAVLVTNAILFSSIDTSVDQPIEIRGLLADVGDTMTLESWSVEVYPSRSLL